MKKKISQRYWDTLNTTEQNYIKERLDKTVLPELKQIIADARKQHPGFTKLFGKGFLVTVSGETLLWSGSDTRQFRRIPDLPF